MMITHKQDGTRMRTIKRAVVSTELRATESGLNVRFAVLECGHIVPASLGTSGYSNPTKKICRMCMEGK